VPKARAQRPEAGDGGGANEGKVLGGSRSNLIPTEDPRTPTQPNLPQKSLKQGTKKGLPLGQRALTQGRVAQFIVSSQTATHAKPSSRSVWTSYTPLVDEGGKNNKNPDRESYINAFKDGGQCSPLRGTTNNETKHKMCYRQLVAPRGIPSAFALLEKGKINKLREAYTKRD